MTSWNDILNLASGLYVACPSEDMPAPDGPRGECLWTIDAKKCTTKGSLFAEFSRELTFPSYFGNNWDAFDECISSLEWLPSQSHLFIIHNAPHLLELGDDFGVFLRILKTCSHDWADFHPGGTFKVVLIVPEHDEAAFRDELETH